MDTDSVASKLRSRARRRHIAVDISSDKELTNQILADVGLPVPRQYSVYREESALKAANRLGFPVVVKPYNANHGRGVSIGLTTDDQVKKLFSRPVSTVAVF